MKPQDLKSPYLWHERKPLLLDQVFYIPVYYMNYSNYQLPQLSELFGNSNPIEIEYCSGNGLWIMNKAQTHPHYNWIAVEKKFDRVQKIWSKMKNLGLKNLLIVCGEAHTFTHYYLSKESISNIYINFPDPWPKLRHAKHRLLTEAFLEELARVLVANGSITFTTDDVPYSEAVLDLLLKNNQFCSNYAKPYFRDHMENYGTSYFEDLWRRAGRIIRYFHFNKLS